MSRTYSKQFREEALELSDEIDLNFAALNKEKLYRIPTYTMTREQVKTIVFFFDRKIFCTIKEI